MARVRGSRRRDVSAGELVRFCNNPTCDRCDEHLRPREVLRKGGREVCPLCHEDLVVRPARPRRLLPRPPRPPRPGAGAP